MHASAFVIAFALLLAPVRVVGLAIQDSLRPDTSSRNLRTGAGIHTASSDSERIALDAAAVAALADTAATRRASDGTPVLLFGREIFRVFSGIGPYSEDERADRIAAQLTELARSKLEFDSLQIVDGRDLTLLRLERTIVMSVTDADARGLRMSRIRAAHFYGAAIRKEIADVRKHSTLKNLAIRTGLALLLLGLLYLFLKALGRLYRWLDTHVVAVGKARIRPVTFGRVEFLSADRIVNAGRAAVQLLRIAIAGLLVYLYLTTVFGLFPWTQSWSKALLHYMITPLAVVGRTVVDALPNLLAIVVIVVVIRWVIKLSNFFFSHLREGHISLPGFYREFAEPTRKIARFLLIMLGVLLVYPYTPVAESRVFQGLTIFLGILFSIGSSTAIANVVAGVVLTYTRSFQLGDRIRVGETSGDVIEKSFLVTRIRTPKHEDVAIPNSAMLSSQITNYSSMVRSGGAVILHTTVSIGYDVPWATVERLLLEAAARTSDIEKDPPPFVLTTGLGDFSVSYQLNVYTRKPDRMARLYSDLHRHVQDTFAEKDVEILSPVYEAHRDGNAPTIPPLPDGLLQDGRSPAEKLPQNDHESS